MATSAATQISGAGAVRMAAKTRSTIKSGPSYLARNPGESRHKSKRSAARVLPDPATCRAKSAGFGDYADCLVEHPFECPYAFGFGYGYLCQHAQRNEIVARTSANGRETLSGPHARHPHPLPPGLNASI